MYGLLDVLNDLGLDLLDVHQSAGGAEDGPALRAESDAPLVVDVVVRGSLGPFAMTALGDHVEVTHLATRLALSDRRVLDEVLDWVRGAGAAIEYAAEDPSPTCSLPARPARGVDPDHRRASSGVCWG